MNVIEFRDVWEKYRIKFINEGKVSWEEFFALKEINCNVGKGEVLGVIGQNGAGKTTFLRLIAGMLMPDRGSVDVKGKVSALMELGAGFNPEFTGRENLMLNARMYGIGEGITEEKLEEIISFAGLDKFIDAPVKYYSQGMYMRLAFSLAIHIEPDIFLIDDILAVGDEEARNKCVKEIFALKQKGKTIVIVSHDLGMINKLCNRVILLEGGRIIKEGLASEVVPYYLETVGNKKGIAVLEKAKLRVVFNNGRLIVSYAGVHLTTGAGVYVSFAVPELDLRSCSFNLDWNIESCLEAGIIVNGLKDDGIVSQTWHIRIEEDKLNLRVKIKDSAVKDPHIDFFMVSGYKSWMNLEKKGSFPGFSHKTIWQDLGLAFLPEDFLGIAADDAEADLAPFLLEADDKQAEIKLFNSGYEEEARIIKAYLGSRGGQLNIKLFPSNNGFREYLDKAINAHLTKQQEEQARIIARQEEEKICLLARQREEEDRLIAKQREEEAWLIAKQREEEANIITKQQEEQALLLSGRTITNGALKLFADPQGKSLTLYYKDRPVTKAGGLNTSFSVKQDKFYLINSNWQLQKVSEQKLILRVDYPLLSMSQILTLFFREENVLNVKIELELLRPMRLYDFHIELMLKDGYKHWQTEHEKGELSASEYINEIAPVRLKNSRASAVILKTDDNLSGPAIFFEASYLADRQILSIYRHLNEECGCINFASVLPNRKEWDSPGRHTFFEGNIILNSDRKLVAANELDKSERLSRGGCRCIFDQGRLRMVWQEKELTSGLGGYTSLRCSGIWYDSFQAVWEITHNDGNMIRAVGDWPYIPISQTWQIELIEKYLIRWKVKMDVYEEVNLDILQANLMLCPSYNLWFAGNSFKGSFIDEYTDSYDILPFRFWYGKPTEEGIRAASGELPDVCFLHNGPEGQFRGIIENSDFIYKARLIQYQKPNKTKLLPGAYEYFEGAIKIEPKK